MTIVGEWITPTLTAADPSVIDGTTVVALSVRKPDGTVLSPALVVGAPTAGVYEAEAYELTQAGEWVELWTITGSGAGAAEVVRLVDPVPPRPSLTYADTYATSQQYADYTGSAGPANLPLLLRRASRNVDAALLTAVYSLTDTGTDGRLISVSLADATIEQVSFLLEIGYANGLPGNVQSVTIGSVQIGRGYSSAGGGSNDLPFSDVAWQILQRAGLTGHAALTEVGPPSNLVVVT